MIRILINLFSIFDWKIEKIKTYTTHMNFILYKRIRYNLNYGCVN